MFGCANGHVWGRRGGGGGHAGSARCPFVVGRHNYRSRNETEHHRIKWLAKLAGGGARVAPGVLPGPQ